MKKIKIIFMALFLLFVMPLVASSVNADTMSDEFKSYLNEEGKFVVNSIKPTNHEEFWTAFELLYCDDSEGICSLFPEEPNSDFTSATITLNQDPDTGVGERHTVPLVYKYDEDIKATSNEYMNKIPEDKETFDIIDMEGINYIYNGKGDVTSLSKYSGELKEYIDYSNFSIDVRFGDDSDMFLTRAGGAPTFMYNNTFYGMLNRPAEMFFKHVIYVPDSTGDTKDELMQAAQERIDDYIGENKVTLSYLGTGIYELYMAEIQAEIDEAQRKLDEFTELLATLTENTPEYSNARMEKMYYEGLVESCQSRKEHFDEEWNDAYAFLKEAEGDFYFNAKVFAGTENERDYYYIIVKDSSKMVNPVVKTTDAKTDITITPADNSIPLDTIIKAEKLTSGTEYEKVINALDVENHETFDLTLYSDSISQNIATGNFEVKIPVSDTLRDKALMAYYVDNDNKVEEHEVAVRDGYATFTTDHFSIYTLAEKKGAGQIQDNTPTKGEKDETPKTGTLDIINYILIATFISAIGIIGVKKMV